MIIHVLTLFPDMVAPMLSHSVLGRAIERELVEVRVGDIRAYTKDKHRKVDDTPFGGGAGMILAPQPAFDALRAVGAGTKRTLYMSPRGARLDQELLSELGEEPELVILCGHYEGIDQRIIDAWAMQEVSIGDYILTGGELPALVLIDALARRLPGVLGNEASHEEESIYSGLLEYDQYTKPREYEGYAVPEVLYGGNHQAIRAWQWERALELTRERRPDLFQKFLHALPDMTKEERLILRQVLEKSPVLEDEE